METLIKIEVLKKRYGEFTAVNGISFGIRTPTHAISALNKTLIMNMDVLSIIPEIISIIVLTILYFLIGGIIFKQRHLKPT